MAQRYGGRFSPENSRPAEDAGPTPADPFRGRRRSLIGGRVNAILLVPLLFTVMAFREPPLGLALDLATCGILLLAAWLTRAGLIAQEAYEARDIARRPAIPRKIFGSVATGIGLALGAYSPAHGLIAPLILGLISAGLHLAAFGPDPLGNKGMTGENGFDGDCVARAFDTAETHIAAMKTALTQINDRALAAHLDSFIATARQIFRSVENDPRDLAAARKYLGVYLMGASDATAQFVSLYSQNRDLKARSDHEALITDLETNFRAQTQALLANDKINLDIQIEVPRDRLKQEGIRS